MARRRWVVAGLLGGGLVLVGVLELGRRGHIAAVSGLATGGSARPNVLIIVADDLGVDKVGSYVYDADPEYPERAEYLPNTPVLDDLAQAGIRFTDAWANPSCSPTRASLATGTYGFRHGVGQPIGKAGSSTLGLDETTIAHVAADAGYATGMFGKWHLGDEVEPGDWEEGESWADHLDEAVAVEFPSTTLGWSVFRGTKADLDVGEWSGYYDWMRLTATTRDQPQVVPSGESRYATLQTTDDALDWIDRQSGPWLALVNYHAPHTPLEAPPPSCGYGTARPQGDLQTYQAKAECLDAEIGRLLEGIDQLPSTVVFLMGDNGTDHMAVEDVFDDDRNKGTLYESGIRVPLIVADGYDYLSTLGEEPWGREPTGGGRVLDPGREIADPVHVLDTFATVADLVGGDKSSGVDSVSLLPLMRDGPGVIRQTVYSDLFSADSGAAAIRKNAHKLIVSVGGGEGSLCRYKYELYNVVSDRFEEQDLASNESGIFDDLLEELDALLATHEGAWLDLPDC